VTEQKTDTDISNRLRRRTRRISTTMTRPSSRRSVPVRQADGDRHRFMTTIYADTSMADEKARKDLAAKAGGKGPLNTGTQGIKKSGKK